MNITPKIQHQILVAWIALLCVSPTWAAGAPWDNATDGILDAMNGGVMRTIAIIVVMFVGIGVIAGRVGMDMAVKLIVGIIIIFSSTALVDLIAGWST